jgi:multiple sugar transport system ATP-binding protein
MRTELSKLHDRLQTTMIYVTHDQVEAMTMGDRICVMKDGMIQQIAQPIELYNHPETKFVAGFIGSPPMNFVEVFLEEKSGDKEKELWVKENLAEPEGLKLKLTPELAGKVKEYIGKKVILGIRPEDIYDRLVHSGAVKEGSCAKAQVEVVEPMGAEKYLYLNTGKSPLVARVEPNNSAKAHQEIEIAVNLERVRFFDSGTMKKII